MKKLTYSNLGDAVANQNVLNGAFASLCFDFLARLPAVSHIGLKALRLAVFRVRLVMS